MAEEDLLFGKNRHFFGGVEPSNMRVFNASSNYVPTTSTARIKLAGQLPLDTVIDGQTLCTVEGAIIRRSTSDYPEDEFSGTAVADVKPNFTLADPYAFTIYDASVTVGTTYYYAAFPYTKQGVYNRNRANRTKAKAATYTYLFGYDLTVGTNNPTTRVAYPMDVDNANYTAAKMNYTSDAFDYGSWPSTAGEKFMPKPVMLGYDGVVKEHLNQNDYTKKTDGTTSSVANAAFLGNAMMEWSKIYTKREYVNGVYKFRCSDIPLGDDWDCWSNYDKNNNEIDHFYTPIYFGSNSNSRLRSISGQDNYVNNTPTTELSLARANGDGWCTEVLVDRLLIQDLLVLMSKSTDTQTAYGTGRCASGNTSTIGQGTMNTNGLFWGSTNQTSGVKVFGMENWWGNIWRRTAGWINAKGTQKVKLTQGTHDGSTATDYNLDGTGYLTLSGATPAGTSSGYISAMKNDLPYGRIPVTAGGSSSTYEADDLWFNNSQVNYALVGGGWESALFCGAFCADLNAAASSATAYRGAALSCKPLAA